MSEHAQPSDSSSSSVPTVRSSFLPRVYSPQYTLQWQSALIDKLSQARGGNDPQWQTLIWYQLFRTGFHGATTISMPTVTVSTSSSNPLDLLDRSCSVDSVSTPGLSDVEQSP